ncbi:MAG TPA: HEAT repeat domain-containing protein [Longimicrobium sp.]|nr:HEAT repeat domain-containing protein [Longimicrobium sp.]
MTIPLADLSFWNDADDLLSALYRVDPTPVPELRSAVANLCDHSDPDVREEALRILATRWKDAEGRRIAVVALQADPAANVQSAAAIAVAVTSDPSTCADDTRVLLAVLRNAGIDPDVRGAAYDALVILHRRGAGSGIWPFPTKQRPFDPDRDVDWQWIGELERTAS